MAHLPEVQAADATVRHCERSEEVMSDAYSAGYTAATTPHYTTIPAEYNADEADKWIDGFTDCLQVRLQAALGRDKAQAVERETV